jgi:RNA polymerase sigma-70 factor, ECF subfamily
MRRRAAGGIILAGKSDFFLERRMNEAASEDVTRILAESAEDSGARARLLEAIYEELHGIAGGFMRRERADHTLQATALVHEAVLRIFGSDNSRFESRAHLFGAAAEAMRRILIDHARQKAALKRGGGVPASRLEAGEPAQASNTDAGELLAVDEALTRLESVDPRKAQIVKLRFYGGLGMEQIADALEISVITVKRDWRFARAWLAQRLEGWE